MPTNVWPPGLPQVQLNGASARQLPQFLETRMDVGPPKRRRISQVVYEEESVPVIFSATDVGVFRTFWNTTLLGGVDSFEWEDVVNDATVDYEFRDSPKFQLVAGSDVLAGRRYRAVLLLRRLP